MPTFDEVWKSVAPLWAAVNGAEARVDGDALVLEEAGTPFRLVPSADAIGGSTTGDAIVFAIATSDVEQPPALPEGGDVVEAPLGLFDAVELTLFGRPAAKGRIAFGDGLAVVGRFEFEPGPPPEVLGPPVLSALAEEAFLEGAETLYTVVDGDGLPSYLGNGWSEAGRLRRG